jgi:protein-S-isoprenylcysteine O-methyltransferase Ste14
VKAPTRDLGRSGGHLLSAQLRAPIAGLLFERALPAVVFGLFLYGQTSGLVRHLEAGPGASWSALFWAHLAQRALATAFMTLVVVLFLVRRPRIGQRSSWPGKIAAFAGTFALMVPLASGVVEDNLPVLLASSVLMWAGTGWALLSLAFLGRCFGMLPEARGLVTRGPYRWVRHPIYLGEMVAGLGLVAATLSGPLFLLFVLWCGLQYWRARNEERALETVFPAYARYRERTYRLLPGLH